MTHNATDRQLMKRALELAERGRGWVEPNPLVGCVIASGDDVIAEGWHERFGGPHAEIVALEIAGPRAAGATMYVTLEPCTHQGKTPPCVDAIVAADLARVVIAHQDPFPKVAGYGIRKLRDAGLKIEVGLLEKEARGVNAPYLKLIETARPWIIAKWAMTLDGRIATRDGESQWISNEASRALVHQLRGRVDAVMVGSGTAHRDDPLLTARPAESRRRTATRVIVDSGAVVSCHSRLVRSAQDVPVLVAVSTATEPQKYQPLAQAGCEVLPLEGINSAERLAALLAELGARRMTNILVEGGARLLGNLLDAQAIDEVHVFIAPKLVGGDTAPGPIAGQGIGDISDALLVDKPSITILENDVYLHGTIRRKR